MAEIKNRQYIVSERAHLMCPNMHYGIMAHITSKFDQCKLQQTLTMLEKAHPFLKSVIARENNQLYYDQHEEIKLTYVVGNDVSKWEEDYRKLTQNGWDVFHEGLLKIVVYPAENNFTILFIVHHLLADGRGALGLMCEFADYYVSGIQPAFVEEQLLTSIDDLPTGSDLPFLSKMVINSANKNWLKEHHAVSYEEYHEFEKTFIRNNPIGFTEESWDVQRVEKLLKECRQENISLNDYLVAEMMCQEGCDKVVIAADIRKLLPAYHQGALGNYATAMGIESKLKTTDLIEKARDISKQIRQHRDDNRKWMLVLACYFQMIPELIDAVAISTLGDYNSKAGKFVGTAMFGYEKREGFSVTNLGNVENKNISEIMFIPPASPANKKTMGVVSANGYLKKCTVMYS